MTDQQTRLDGRSEVLVDQAVRAWRRYMNVQAQMETAMAEMHATSADLTTPWERAEYYRRTTMTEELS